MSTEHIESMQISREAIIEYLKNPDSIQLQYRYINTNDTWCDIDPINCNNVFNLNIFYYRIKPVSKWYRVALMERNITTTADNASEESGISRRKSFIKWITDRIEYD